MKLRKSIGFACLFFLICFVGRLSFADPPLPTPIGRVIWVKGMLKAVMPNNEQRILQKMSVIYLHDTLLTDGTSQAQIAFTDNSLMTFKENTKFYIDQYAYKPKAKGSVGKYIMNLIEGGFRTITGLIAKSNPSDYQINTPVATIGVRGTDYAVYLQGQELFVGYYSGKPCMRNKQGELCLSETKKFGQVSANKAPVPLSQQPDVFKTKLDIIPATIAPFGVQVQSVGSKGPITSFCIEQ